MNVEYADAVVVGEEVVEHQSYAQSTVYVEPEIHNVNFVRASSGYHHGSPDRGNNTGSAVGELLSLRFTPADLVGVQGESPVNRAVVEEIGELRSRLEVFEDNQKTLEENQRLLLSEQKEVKEYVEKAASDVENLRKLFDLHKYDLAQLANSPQPKQISVIHGTPLFSGIITRFNEMVSTINSLADHVEASMGVVGAGEAVAAMSENMIPSSSTSSRQLFNNSLTHSPITVPVASPTPRGPPGVEDTLVTDSYSEHVQAQQQKTILQQAHKQLDTSTFEKSPSGLPYVGLEIMDGNELPGVVVMFVKEGSPADKVGLRQHDIILNFNGYPVSTKDEFRLALSSSPSHIPLKIHYIPGGANGSETNPTVADIVLGKPTADRASPTPTIPSSASTRTSPSSTSVRAAIPTTNVGRMASSTSGSSSGSVIGSPMASDMLHTSTGTLYSSAGSSLHGYTREEYVTPSSSSRHIGPGSYVVVEERPHSHLMY